MAAAPLKETPRVRQIEGEPRRRWFSAEEVDLIVWLDEAGAPFGFQFCYEKQRREHALTWEAGRGYDHAAVDYGGHSRLSHTGTPILRSDRNFDCAALLLQFDAISGELPADVRDLVRNALAQFPNSPEIAARRPPPLARKRPWWKFWG